jgi:hypothetical protein
MINFRVSTFSAVAAAAGAAAGYVGAAKITNKLSAALAQTNQFLEGNSVVNRHTSVMFSRELLVFYVDRRSYAFNTNTVMANMARLPTAIAGFERINDIDIELQENIFFGGKDETSAKEIFALESIVIADVNSNINANTGNPTTDTGNYVIGSSALIRTSDQNTDKKRTNSYYHYAPTKALKHSQNKVYNNEPNWKDMAKKTGVIFIYKNNNYSEKIFDF